MARRRIGSGSPWETRAAYSRAVADGPWCFVAGTTGFDPGSGHFPDGAGAQTRLALATVEAALRESGFALSDVVRARYYVTDRGDVPEVMDALRTAFADIPTAATMVIADLIDPAMKVEIEVTAFRPHEPGDGL